MAPFFAIKFSATAFLSFYPTGLGLKTYAMH